MPFYADSFLLPTSPYLPYLMEDKYLKGGFQCVKDNEELLAINKYQKKDGMLVFVGSDLDGNRNFYQWNNPLDKWELAEMGSGAGGGNVSPVDPLYIEPSDGTLRIRESRTIPSGGTQGQIVSKAADGTLIWRNIDASEDKGARATIQYTSPQLLPGEEHLFQLEIGRSVLLLECEVNAIDVELKAFTSFERVDLNPFTFISDPDYTREEGIVKKGDGTIEYRRRNTILTNTEETVADIIYFNVRNVGGVPATPTYSFVYVGLE